MSEKTKAPKETPRAVPSMQAEAMIPAEILLAPAAPMRAPDGGNLAMQNLLRRRIIQARLEVGRPDDPLEREADAAAERCERGTPCGPSAMSCGGCNHQTVQRKPGDEPYAGVRPAPMEAPSIQAKSTAGRPADPLEREADSAAERTKPSERCDHGTPCPSGRGRSCRGCSHLLIQRKTESGQSAPRAKVSLPKMIPVSEGNPLPAGIRSNMEALFGRDFSDVRVHTDSWASRSAAAISAQAYTYGRDIVFGQDRYAPDTREGRSLLAHELAHTVQQDRAGPILQRNDEHDETPTPEENSAATSIVQAVRSGDVGGAVRPLRGMSRESLRSVRQLVKNQTGEYLEHWLAGRQRQASRRETARTIASTALAVSFPSVGLILGTPGIGGESSSTDGTAEEGIRLLLPALPLIDKLEMYDEGYREIEQAQLDTIRSASEQERREAARESARLAVVYSHMSAREEFEARNLMDSSPEALYATAAHTLDLGDDDVLFDAILVLAPGPRRQFVRDHTLELYRRFYKWQRTIIRSMAEGGEGQALIARLRLATECRLDDAAGIQAVVDQAVALLRERRELRVALNAPGLPAEERTRIESRLQELNDLDSLLRFRRSAGGELEENSFIGLLSAARGSYESFGADAQRLAEFASEGADRRRYLFEVAKQRILLAGSNVDDIRMIIMTLHAPPVSSPSGAGRPASELDQLAADVQLRRELLNDPAVAAVVGSLVRSEQMRVEGSITADAFGQIASELNLALNSANYGEFFRLVLRIARNEDWRRRFQDSSVEPFGTYARVHGRPREIMETILRTQRMPLRDVLEYSGNVDLLRTALRDLPESDRAQLREGWALIHNPIVGRPTADQTAAMQAYRDFETRVRASQTSFIGSVDEAGVEAVLLAAMGTEPTERELSTGAGRYNAALWMYERMEARLHLGRGAAAYFTESDETMVAAARGFAALWLRIRDRHSITMVDFAALSTLYERFKGRAEEFKEAGNAIGEMAGMIAATAAGIVVVAATGGAATPGVIALAAAAGAGSRVVTRGMFGDQYYNAMSSEGARDALVGAIDGALAVVSGRLAARGVELMGLSGHALTSSAARIGGEAVERATQSFSRRVAASAVESALDGAFSGAVSEGFGAFTDERSWRRGIWSGMIQVGQSAIIGGLTGLATGGVMGAAMPVAGRGLGWLRNAIVGQSIEHALERAGMRETLTAARAAAGRGDVQEVNRLAAEMETRLLPEEAAALRQQLYEDLRNALGHPPGLADVSVDQARLLNQSGIVEGDLPENLLRNEVDIVRRSRPQPSTMVGYMDEVNLGNGHTWRRTKEGNWCRYSNTNPFCYIFSEGPTGSAMHIEEFPSQRLPRRGEWSGTPGDSDFTPSDDDLLLATGGRPIPFRNGFPDFSQFQVGTPVILPRAEYGAASRTTHKNRADAIYAARQGWRLPDGNPDAARAAAFRHTTGAELTWHHVPGESGVTLELISSRLHRWAQHEGGFAEGYVE